MWVHPRSLPSPLADSRHPKSEIFEAGTHISTPSLNREHLSHPSLADSLSWRKVKRASRLRKWSSKFKHIEHVVGLVLDNSQLTAVLFAIRRVYLEE